MREGTQIQGDRGWGANGDTAASHSWGQEATVVGSLFTCSLLMLTCRACGLASSCVFHLGEEVVVVRATTVVRKHRELSAASQSVDEE